MFKIQIFSKKIKIEDGLPVVLGKIVMNDFEEFIPIPISYWSIQNYKQQWKKGLEYILQNNTSCLVTKIYEPQTCFANIWPMLARQEDVLIRNKLCFGDFYKERFKDSIVLPENAHKFIHEDEFVDEVDEDNNKLKVSEWRVSKKDIQEAILLVDKEPDEESCCECKGCYWNTK